jgi:hypothetical protein
MKMKNSLIDYKDIHRVEPCFIIGSGASLNHYPNINLEGVTIGINRAYEILDTKYTIIHHHPIVQDAIDSGQTVFYSEYDTCNFGMKKASFEGGIMYRHLGQSYLDFNPELIDNPNDEMLLCGGTTVVNGIGLALYMGCKTIILVGCDAGAINGRVNVNGYYQDSNMVSQLYHSTKTNALIKKIRDYLKPKGVNILTLSPFLDYNLEGNVYQQ